uniref:Putative secretory peptide-43 n=1 Tax=Pleurobrachia bachei TaxID=34499 RepID=M4H1R6_PLEBA|nr:putative secretory peptide-43 [Pleurobrachia bachei]|eukprot:sb/3466820/
MIRFFLFTAALWGTAALSTDWTAVKREVKIPWDLEGTPLQIKTNSTLDSEQVIRVGMYDKNGTGLGAVVVKFSYTMFYYIGYCTENWKFLPVEPPVEVDKIWTLIKTETALIITCNGVEVLNYVFAHSSMEGCVGKEGDVVEQISFMDSWAGQDTASDFYRPSVVVNTFMYNISVWKTVKRPSVNITWDLETTPLQIKTNSTLGSGKVIRVGMYDNNGTWLGAVVVKFFPTMLYVIGYCTGEWQNLPVQPPVEVDKIWTIAKTDTAFIVMCNGVEVLNYLFANSSNSDCVPNWGGDVVEEIQFRIHDTASDFYRAGKDLRR